MTTPLQGREIEEKKKSIIVELLSLSALQITCAEEKKKLSRIQSLEPRLHSKTMADGQKREQASMGSLGRNPKLKSQSSFCCALL